MSVISSRLLTEFVATSIEPIMTIISTNLVYLETIILIFFSLEAINGCIQVFVLMLTSDICSCDLNCKDSCGSSLLMDTLRCGKIHL